MINVNDYAQIALAAFRLVLTVITVVMGCIVLPWLRKDGIPWLKEHRLYALVSKFVFAAEKVYEYDVNASRDKYEYVISKLADKGVEITDEVRGYIESAVEELDIITMEAMNGVVDIFDDEEEEEGPPQAETSEAEKG